jgi:cobalt-zinc-cadmium efflux system membrane fusion protein
MSRPSLPPLALLGAALGLAAGCARPAPATAAPPAAAVTGTTVTFPANAPQLAYISAQPAQPRTVALSHLTGRLYLDDDHTVRVFTPVAGQVVAVHADIGSEVEAGTPLADINSPDYDQARADARTAEANLAAADKANARTRDLQEHGAAAEKDVEAAEAAYRAALAERDRAVDRLRLYDGGTPNPRHLYTLRSPLQGTVAERNLNPGQEVRADQMLANATNLFAPLFVISNLDRLWLQVDVAAADLSALEPGQRVRVRADAYPGEEFGGTVTTIAPELDPSTRTIKVRGVVDNPGHRLKAEMYVTVDVVRDESKVKGAGVEVPAKAAFRIDPQDYVFVQLAPGRFERRAVTLGPEQDGRVAVLTGVSAGETVVAEGALLLESVLQPAD